MDTPTVRLSLRVESELGPACDWAAVGRQVRSYTQVVSLKMKDIQGINRGKCNLCECNEYSAPPPGVESSSEQPRRLRCEYCNHTPVDHVRLIALGGCISCGTDNCDQYESEDKNSYTDCGYCGCSAKLHAGAEKLIKKKQASTAGAVGTNTSSGIVPQTDSFGKPVQSFLQGICKNPGCVYPRREENGYIHDYCSRTCSAAAASRPAMTQGSPSSSFGPGSMYTQGPPPSTTSSGSSGPVMCSVCHRNPPNLGHSWCPNCYSIAESQKLKKK